MAYLAYGAVTNPGLPETLGPTTSLKMSNLQANLNPSVSFFSPQRWRYRYHTYLGKSSSHACWRSSSNLSNLPNRFHVVSASSNDANGNTGGEIIYIHSSFLAVRSFWFSLFHKFLRHNSIGSLKHLFIRGALGWKRTPELSMLRLGHCRGG